MVVLLIQHSCHHVKNKTFLIVDYVFHCLRVCVYVCV